MQSFASIQTPSSRAVVTSVSSLTRSRLEFAVAWAQVSLPGLTNHALRGCPEAADQPAAGSRAAPAAAGMSVGSGCDPRSGESLPARLDTQAGRGVDYRGRRPGSRGDPRGREPQRNQPPILTGSTAAKGRAGRTA